MSDIYKSKEGVVCELKLKAWIDGQQMAVVSGFEGNGETIRWLYLTRPVEKLRQARPSWYEATPSKKVAATRAILRRYIGVKDMHGVEIFEGDLLEYVPSEYVGPGRPERYVVEWCHHGFGARWINPPGPDYRSDPSIALEDCDENMKVIGNIYENAELVPGYVSRSTSD